MFTAPALSSACDICSAGRDEQLSGGHSAGCLVGLERGSGTSG